MHADLRRFASGRNSNVRRYPPQELSPAGSTEAHQIRVDPRDFASKESGSTSGYRVVSGPVTGLLFAPRSAKLGTFVNVCPAFVFWGCEPAIRVLD